MNLFRKAVSLFKRNNSEQSDGEEFVKKTKTLLAIGGSTFFPVIAPVVILIIIIIVVVASLFGYEVEMMQLVDSNEATNEEYLETVTYDEATLEEYYQLSEKAYETDNIPSTDLRNTQYGSVSAFNQHIKDTVCMHGYGTRQGVVAAGMSLIGDYIKATGKRIRYDQAGRQQPGVEGIVNSDFYLDCSGFAWWALYNGGFNLPNFFAQTDNIYSWAVAGGITKDATKGGGQGGDFLIKRGKGHIMLIVGTYSNGYYIAEESVWGEGGKIRKIDYSSLGNYVLMDMTKYYTSASNVRPSSYTCPKTSTLNTSLVNASDGERMARLAAIISGSVGGTRKQALRHNSGDNSSISFNNAGYYADEYYPELYEYYAIHDMAAGSNASRPAKYAQCDVSVGTIIAAAYDPSTPVTGDSWWTSTHKYTGKGYSDLGIIKGSDIPSFCKPGDILTCIEHSHVMMYVGNNIVREYHPSAASDICMFEGGGNNALYPGLTSYKRAGHDKNTWRVFRPTGDIKNHISKKISVNFEVYGISNPDYYSETEHKKAIERVLSYEGRYVKGKNGDVAGTLGKKYSYKKNGKTYNAYWSRADELLRNNKGKIAQLGGRLSTIK